MPRGRSLLATLLFALALAAVVLLAAVGGGPGAPKASTARGFADVATTGTKRLRGFPRPETTGVPAGWKPAQTRTSDLHVTEPGAVVQDVLLQNADLIVDAPNVTIRRVKLQGGRITNYAGPRCEGPMTIEHTTIQPPPGRAFSVESEGVIDAAAYTARRVKIWRRSEGFRLTGNGFPGCDPIRIQDSFVKIVIPPGRCDLHADGIQGYGGPHTTVVNTTVDFKEATCGTAPFFVPKGQDNTSVTVRRLLVMGGGYPFRLGVPANVSGLKIVNRSWVFGPIDVACSLVRSWDASIVAITSRYQIKRTIRAQRCNTESGT
jgi:hypothetical protein